MTRSTARRLGLAVLCGAVGAAVNSLPIDTVAPLTLGRIATLPIAILCGPLYGALSAAIGALGVRGAASIISIAILIIEGVLLGEIARRGKSPLLAGALIWSAAAAGLAVAPRWYGVESLGRAVWPIALQVVLNGLVAIVVADLIATAVSAQRLMSARPIERRRIRNYAFHAFVL